MTDRNVCPTDHGRRTTDFRNGFTLVEVMMTLVFIAVLMTLGWGVLYKIIDPASKESAQNLISASLNTARNRAMALQKTGGILFFIDPRSNRVSIANVTDTGPQENDGSFITRVQSLGGLPPEVYLDLADTEFTPLPSGVTLQVLNNAVITNGVVMNDQFIGFNRFQGPSNTLSIPLGGAILFDGHGELVCRRWAMRFKSDPIGSRNLADAVVSPMLQLLFYDKAPDDPYFRNVNLNWCDALQVFFPRNGPNPQVLPLSTMGVAILDLEKFMAATGRMVPSNVDPTTDDQFRQGYTAMSTGERNKEQWIAQNARVMMIGRYSGTLIDTRVTQ
ncbi:MAG: Tfp pilus assembly protein FimT/FimU [Tepidisphaerales bacterium]